ncbi:hypothetical protein HDU76_010258, partial [Blyttiomyces sp. JEL0837]
LYWAPGINRLTNKPRAAPVSTFSDDMTEVSVSSYSKDDGGHDRRGENSNTKQYLSHINLRGAYFKYKQASGTWSQWYQSGVTLFQRNNEKWIVFELDDNSVSWSVSEQTTVVVTNDKFIHLSNMGEENTTVKTNGGEAYLELDNEDRRSKLVVKLTGFIHLRKVSDMPDA